jgi:16S rRNA (uracil1498-N3)-methyltransferase
MQRIYLPDTQFSEILEITQKELYHQLTRVLRARVDQEVIFFDGITLQDHIYVMVHINKNTVSFRRKEVISKSSELYLELTLYQALPNKFEKLEYIMQKCVEVGYKKIVFFSSERSQKLIISENKKQRFQKILIEAVEQCGGNIVPEIEFESSFL